MTRYGSSPFFLLTAADDGAVTVAIWLNQDGKKTSCPALGVCTKARPNGGLCPLGSPKRILPPAGPICAYTYVVLAHMSVRTMKLARTVHSRPIENAIVQCKASVGFSPALIKYRRLSRSTILLSCLYSGKACISGQDELASGCGVASSGNSSSSSRRDFLKSPDA
eukprot:CAMPEP_0178440610 /NCGR_PEP_ID=MMETSP0689_2-20121128/36892_1 /TAXON_ID=160604 /ORGANISM="Amphidinium massartii, Strain CS-259" /LENGTH=165 /DNA_ID=CAMNT_0020063439 /DNA_START=180 /DNA_END=675 /DNA_ORIENTATION=-